jgi:hypothetical protein
MHDDLARPALRGEPVRHPFGLLEGLARERAAAAGEYNVPLSTRVEYDAD